MAEAEHGTYAGWNQHRRNGTNTCAACRKAQAAYMKARRQRNPDIYAAEKADNLAGARALWRLARIYPRLYAALKAEELAADRRNRAAS